MTSFVSPLQAALRSLASAPQASESQLLDIDGSVLVMLGIFLVLLFILWPLLWRPYLRVRDERVARVEGARDQAAKLEAETASRLARIETSLAEARRGGNAEVGKLRLEGQTREQQILSQAHDAARTRLVEARAKLEGVIAAEKANLQAQTTLLAREIAEKAVGRKLGS